MTTEQLARILERVFGYTRDNNRDLIGDASFPLTSVNEELLLEYAYQYVCAHLLRESTYIDSVLAELD